MIIVALGMAEIASKYPTAGGLYYWASKMGGPAWGWFTGWFNLIGQIAITAGIDYGAAIFTDALLNLLWPGHVHTRRRTRSSTCTPCILGAARADEHLQRQARRVAERHLGVVARLRRADHRRVPGLQAGPPPVVRDRVLEDDQQQRLLAQWLWFVLLLGLLQAQYTFTGYDASAHMSEETQDASRAAARGVIMSVVVSAIFGYILALGVTFAIQNFDGDDGSRASSP